MVSQAMGMLRAIERQYASQGDLPFERLMGEFDAADDDALAELIEADGRARLTLGKRVDLRRYIGAVRDLESRPVPLDAAIDVTLRSLSASSRPTSEAVRALVEAYPHLESQVREAAALAQALWSTTGLRARVEGTARRLPAEFGPRLPSGVRRYVLQRLLGRGGWGEVYLAVDRLLSDRDREAMVAIKVLSGERGPWARQRLIDEATKARRIDHPGVVRVLDRGVTEEDEDYIVYEHVEGGDLGDWLEGRRLPPRAVARLVARIARGVQAAHSALLVHCDLKPANILMTPGDEPKVADFGIAIRHGEGPETIREHDDGRPVGNIAFISPEQYRMDEGCLSVASDVYALGGMLYFLITRRFPNGSSVEEIERNHLPGGRIAPPSLIHSGAAGVDRDLDAICRRALAVDPRERYLTAGALANDLEAWAGGRPIEWLEPGPVRRVQLWCRRRPALAGVAAVATIAIAAGTSGSAYLAGLAGERGSRATAMQARAGTAKELLMQATRQQEDQWRAAGLSFDLLPTSIVMDWALGGKILADPLNEDGGWRMRIANVRRLLAERQGGRLATSIETLMWEAMLGYWLINDGQPGEAEEVLDRNLAALHKKRLDESDDPWIGFVEELRAIALIRRVRAQIGDGSLSSTVRAEVEPAADLLERCLSKTWLADGGAAQQIALIALMEVNGPEMLDRSEPFQRALLRASVFYFMHRTNEYDLLGKAIKSVQENEHPFRKPKSR